MSSSTDPQFASLLKSLNEYGDKLWEYPERVPLLPENSVDAVLGLYLERACRCQNDGNIALGRKGLWSLPRDWAIQAIPKAVASTLNLNDEWEYRRLLEVYEQLDQGLLKSLVGKGFTSLNPEVVEAAHDFTRLVR